MRDSLSRHIYYYVRMENRVFQGDDVKEKYPWEKMAALEKESSHRFTVLVRIIE